MPGIIDDKSRTGAVLELPGKAYIRSGDVSELLDFTLEVALLCYLVSDQFLLFYPSLTNGDWGGPSMQRLVHCWDDDFV